jgi:serine/threonine protein kinase/alpha-tubulin suppressor-like RCC1 family protein
VFANHRDESPRFAELNAEYEVLHELGGGGTTVVYLARERELGREVAIKVVRSTYVEHEEATARLLREARTIAGLQHPNIVTLYGTRRLGDGSLALIMQYIRGRTLKSEIQERGALPVAEAERILADLANALAYLQSHRVLHRDINPENVYLDEETGRALLADFSLACLCDDRGLTLAGTANGTPAYMSPEQIDGATLDARSDIYSLGVVAHEMLSGNAPWTGESLLRRIHKQKHEDLPALSEVRPDTPPRLRYVVDRALFKEPAERWANADDLVAALTDVRHAAPWPEWRSPDRAQSSAVLAPAVGDTPPAEGATIAYRASDSDRPELPYLPTRAAPLATGDDFPLVLAPPRAQPERPGRLQKMVVAYLLIIGVVGTTALVVLGGDDDRRAASAEVVARPGGTAPAMSGQRPTGAPEAADETVPARVFPIFGSAQAGIVGDTLPTPLVVRVEDTQGRTVSGALVAFSVTEGRGSVEPATALSDEHGLATVRWLPQEPGLHVVEAVVSGADMKAVTFRARVSARSAVRLTSATAERGGASGSEEASVVSVRAEDDRGDPVAGAEVRFSVSSGGGRIEPASAITARDGTVRVKWLLGAGSTQEAIATLPGRQGEGTLIRAATLSRLAVRAGVTVGGTHTCALQPGGSVRCWGGNESAQLGAGSKSRRPAQSRVELPEPIANLSAGVSHTCGVSVVGNAFCWGANEAGQLGDGTLALRDEPVRVRVEGRFKDIFTGAAHTCALDASGRLYCWGRNTHGQLGDGTRTNRAAPVRVGGNRTFVSAAVGWAHTCALMSNGSAFCWGRNTSGELGDGRTVDRSSSAPVAGGHSFTAIAAGNAHTCGLTTGGAILCWGQNAHGQLGHGGRGDSLEPVPVATSQTFAQVTVGSVHSCGLTRGGEAFCWGRNNYGQLGDGTMQDRTQPVAVEGGVRFSSLHANGAHTCGTGPGSGETGYCWGFNLSGQLGDGTRANRTRPAVVRKPEAAS